jgi:RND family efflux transporter MFP subunit
MRPIIVVPVLVLASLVGTAGWFGVRSKQNHTGNRQKEKQLVVTTTAKREDLLITVTQTGSVAAKKTTPVIPELSGIVQWVCANGIIVSPGETILRLDPTQVQEQFAALTVRYQEALLQQTQSNAAGKANMEGTQLRLKRAEDQVSSFERQQDATLKMSDSSIKFNAGELRYRREDVEATRRMAAKGYVAGTEVERQNAALKSAEFSVQRGQSDYDLKKSQVESDTLDRQRTVNNTMQDMSRTRGRSDRQVRWSGNQVDNLKLQLDRAQADLARTTIAAPVGGLLVVSALGGWRGESHLPLPGDWISQGREVAQIVSLDHLQVKLELDQTQIAGVTMHQAAEVTIDARPGEVLKGTVTAIGQTARRPPVQGWMGMSASATFPVTIDLPPTGKALIRPGMRASVRIVSRRIKNVVVVPSGCIFRRDGKSIVFAERNGKFVAVAVTPGESNGDYTAIKSGLKQGERIALNDLGTPIPTTASPQGRQEPQP